MIFLFPLSFGFLVFLGVVVAFLFGARFLGGPLVAAVLAVALIKTALAVLGFAALAYAIATLVYVVLCLQPARRLTYKQCTVVGWWWAGGAVFWSLSALFSLGLPLIWGQEPGTVVVGSIILLFIVLGLCCLAAPFAARLPAPPAAVPPLPPQPPRPAGPQTHRFHGTANYDPYKGIFF